MWHMGDGWGWWMGFGLIWMIVPMAVIAWAMLRHTERARARHEPRGLVEPSSQEILEQRYAAGELSDEQYEAMRSRLSQPSEPIAA